MDEDVTGRVTEAALGEGNLQWRVSRISHPSQLTLGSDRYGHLLSALAKNGVVI